VYNVGIDFMLLEGFEILGKKKIFVHFIEMNNFSDSPPSAMRTILQNQWFSETFREQALNKAVSCALKVRRATTKVTEDLKKKRRVQSLRYHFSSSIKMDF
jgi:hypothetical protein